MRHRSFHHCLPEADLALAYGLDAGLAEHFRGVSADALRARQEGDFRRCLARAWQIPFYQRLWGSHGLSPGDVRGLDDIGKLPVFGKPEIMESVAQAPPLGDFHGWRDGTPAGDQPVILHTTSGTTGRPQPLMFSPKAREVQAILLARLYRWQGLKPDDVVHSVYGHGMINGGHYVREAVTRHTGALFLSAGTGVETRSAQQIALLRDFRATVLVGFADYLRRLATLAVESGLVPGRDLPVRMISGHLGRESRESLSQAWGGAELFDWYGVGDTGVIAGEGPAHDGLYLMEDAHHVEILDVDSGMPVADGQAGDLVVTCLYRDDVCPVIRFNTHDVTRMLPATAGTGLPLRRIAGFLGRSDAMVKLRGINVYPQALGPLLEGIDERFTGEFLCVASRDDQGRDEMLVRIEVRAGSEDPGLAGRFRDGLRAHLGVEVSVALETAGALAALTGTEGRQKPVRLLDRRFA